MPHALVGQQIAARVATAVVELMHRGQRVASHARDSRQGGFTTITAHMPAAHRAHLEWPPTRLIHWRESIGPATAEAVTLDGGKPPPRAWLPRLPGFAVAVEALRQ